MRGVWFNQFEYFAPYAVYLNEAGEIYLRKTPLTVAGSQPSEDGREQYCTDDLPRMVLLVGSALGCAGVAHKEWVLVADASAIVAASDTLVTTGADLPKTDTVAAQVKPSTVETTHDDDPYQVGGNMAQFFCNWDSPHFSFLGCLGAAGAGP